MPYNPADWTEINPNMSVRAFGPGCPLYVVTTMVGISGYPTPGMITPGSYQGIFTNAGWRTVDLSDHVPPGTKAVHIVGLLIITHGTTVETADLQVYFRKTGTTPPSTARLWQCCCTKGAGGQRTDASAIIILDDNLCFDMQWLVSTTGVYPAHPAYGLNIWVDAAWK